MINYLIIFILVITTVACQHHKTSSSVSSLPNLPAAVSNNAVALTQTSNGVELYSFKGLSAGKTWQDVNNSAFRMVNGEWKSINAPQDFHSVLASTAVSIGTDVYVIGGYTVAENDEEKSVPEIFKLDTLTQTWTLATNMPVPVDDTVALVYANRYIYLVSGWHDVDNVSLVQVYDTQKNQWFNASSYPAPAVFGHAGGIVDDTMIICDGVKVVVEEKRRRYASSPVCMKGVISSSNPKQIQWSKIDHHSDEAYYRMAAVGHKAKQQIVFAGGSNNPYNYNGIGYNDVPSDASDLIRVYDLQSAKWETHQGIIEKTMDHRSLLEKDGWFYIIGGMHEGQEVSNRVIKFKLRK